MMFKALVKKQLLQTLSDIYMSKKDGRRRSALHVVLYAALLLYCVAVFGGLFFSAANAMCAPLVGKGLDWLFFAIMGALSLLLSIVGSVFMTYSALFSARDNELLLSMPIPPWMILLTRMLGCYAMSFIFVCVVMVPAELAYFIVEGIGAAQLIFSVMILFLLPMLSLSVSCLLGWLIAIAASRFKKNSFVSVVLSLLLLAAYFFVYSKAGDILAFLLDNTELIADKMQTWLWLLYQMGLAAEGDVLSLVIFAAIALGAFCAVCLLLSKSFARIVAGKRAGKRAVYRERKLKSSSPLAALFRRELLHFKSSPVYMLNCSLGTLLMPAAAVFAVVRGGWLLENLTAVPEIGAHLPAVACAVVCAAASVNDLTAPSVSLEGKSLWIVRSFPVSPWNVLLSKLCLHVALTAVPAVVLGICLSCVMRFGVGETVLICSVAGAYTVLSGAVGLAVNLTMPNLNWSSEAVAVKQSFGVMLAMLASWAILLIFGGLYLAVGEILGNAGFLGAALTLMLGGIALAFFWLKKYGSRKFENLTN